MTDTKKIRGRPRKLDRDAAAHSAMKLFWRDGYDGVGMAEMTEALGVKAPSIYATFGSKAQLFAAALASYDEAIQPAFADAFSKTDSNALVGAVLEAAAELYVSDDARPGCLVLDGARNSKDPAARQLAAQYREAFTIKLANRMTDLGTPKAKEVADLVTVAMLGLSGAARSGLEPEVIRASAIKLGRIAKHEV